MASGYIPIYFDWLEVTQDLTAEEKGRLIDAAILYATDGDWESAMTGAEKIAFRFLKGQIDRNSEISEIRKRARLNKSEQTITKVDKLEQRPSNTPKEIKKEKEINKRETLLTECKEKSRFTPPSVEEVEAYCKERGNNVDAQTFVNFYAAKGWMIGKSPMKNWKACIATWERNRGQKKVSAQDFAQRDYSGVQDEMIDEMAREIAAMMEGDG